MKKMVSVYAFSPNMLVDGVRAGIEQGCRKIRPVMSKGQVIAPTAVFEKGLGAEIKINGREIVAALNGRTLKMTEGEMAFEADGEKGEFIAAPRKEKGYLCLPVVECAQALGLSARQYEQLAVIGPEEKLDELAYQGACEELIRKTLGVYNAAYFTAEDFYLAREAWRKDLCGDAQTNDLSIPGMKNILEARDRTSEALRAEMNRGENIPILFGSEPPAISKNLKEQYDKVLRMALAYGTVGCRGYKSKELLSDILYALDWMHDNMYGAKVLSDESYRSYKLFDWWHWYNGGACPMMDTVMIIAEDIGREMVDKYVLPMSFLRTQMMVDLNTSTAMSRSQPLTPLALLTEDRALMQANYLDGEKLLEKHDSGNNMRRDWCCMSHGMPYNIGYGYCNLDRIAKIMKILEDTPLAYPMANKYSIMQMIRYTYAPSLYRGQGVNMMNGRNQQWQTGVAGAMVILSVIKNAYGLFGEEEDREISELLYRNSTPEIREALISYYNTDRAPEAYGGDGCQHIATYGQHFDALTNPKYKTGPYTLGYMWYSGDCCVQFRREYLFALRMMSERVPGYECINGANGDAWYTGNGMLYLYTPDDPDQYSAKWWNGVDKHLLPGTTADAQQRESMFLRKSWMNSQSFVGGVSLGEQFLTASMDLESFHNEVDEGIPDDGYGRSWPVHKCSLTAKKSWFMMDRAVVAIGTAVNAHDGYDVRTVVENRLLPDGLNGVLINGAPMELEPGEEVREEVKSIYLPKAGGYYFPQGGRLKLRYYGTEEARYLAIWFDHRVNPECGEYVYVILPNATAEEYLTYDASDIEILANDSNVQAVREQSSGLTGVVFREAGALAGITAEQPMIVMTRKNGDGMELTACDPTQKLEGFAFAVTGTAKQISCGAGVCAEQAEGKVKLEVTCDSARGRGYRAEIKF